jgi:quercetin dioxygenase-like cupin family protein
MPNTQIVHPGTYPLLDVLGPSIAFLTLPDEPGATYCVMVGTIPPGVSIPLHSHPDFESFYILSGTVEALVMEGNRSTWRPAKTGEFVHVPGDVKHAWRNTSPEPVVQLLTTTPKLGRFFQEIGRAVSPGAPPAPPTPAELQHFAQISARYGYWLASTAENAAIGISF